MVWFVAGFIALRVLGVAFLVLLVLRVAVGARGPHSGARAIMARRFAEGEITEEQFRRMREILESN